MNSFQVCDGVFYCYFCDTTTKRKNGIVTHLGRHHRRDIGIYETAAKELAKTKYYEMKKKLFKKKNIEQDVDVVQKEADVNFEEDKTVDVTELTPDVDMAQDESVDVSEEESDVNLSEEGRLDFAAEGSDVNLAETDHYPIVLLNEIDVNKSIESETEDCNEQKDD